MDATKSEFQRKAICEEIKGKLMTFGVMNPDDFPPIKKLFEIMAEYEKPDNTQSFSGRIPFPEIDRFIEYKFPMRLCNEASVRMVVANRPPTARPGFRQQRKPTKAQAAAAEAAAKKKNDTTSTNNPESPAQ